MKILQILPELNVGGVETGTVDFAKYLVRHGHTSLVVSNGGELVDSLEQSGTKHYTLPVHKKSLWGIGRMVKALRGIIQSEGVDVVHARSRVPAWIAYFACRQTKAVFITTCHGYYKNRIFSQVMGWPKLVIVPSEAIARHMMDDLGVSSGSIRCIPRSIDPEKFDVQRQDAPGKSFYTITIVGRITPLKGHTFFFKSMAKVARVMPNIRIWVIGDAPAARASYKREIEALVRRLGLQGRVDFLGNRQDVPQLLSHSDVLVLATITQEAFGRVILEAQAAGVPVVATSVGGVVDIIEDGKTGLLVLPKDTDAMAREVMRVLKDRQLALRLVEAARKKLKEEFTLDQMASRTIRVYEELLSTLNVLVIKISSPGDVVLVTPSLRALRGRYPQAKIYCLVGRESRKILQNCPYVDGLVIYDARHKHKGWIRTILFSHKLRKYRFDKIIDFQNSRKSHLLAFLSFPKESYGFRNGKWGRLLSHPVRTYSDDLPPVEHQFQMLKALDIPCSENTRLELWPSARDREHVRELLDSEWLGNSTNIAGLNIAASEKWQTKNWPIESMARLCDILAGKNIRVLITGMEKDRWRGQELLSKTRSKPAVFIGRTDFLHLAVLIEKCKVYITPDSAPLHVAAAMGTPVIALFGPTDSRRHKPPAQQMIIFEKKLTCAPCYRPQCPVMTHVCMRGISPEEVAARVMEFMEDKKLATSR